MARLNATAVPEKPEILDRKIDAALDRVQKFTGFWLRILAVIGVASVIAWVIFFSPQSETLTPIFFQIMSLFMYLLFVMFLMIMQFVAMFWFLGRTRVYWILPGETGLSFEDYKGNPEISRSPAGL